MIDLSKIPNVIIEYFVHYSQDATVSQYNFPYL